MIKFINILERQLYLDEEAFIDQSLLGQVSTPETISDGGDYLRKVKPHIYLIT